MPVFQTAPAPLRGHAQHRVGQCAQIIGNLFDGELLLHVARQRPEHFSVVGPSQQIQQSFLVIFSGNPQRLTPLLQLVFEFSRNKPFFQHVVASQLINDPGVFEQVARRPSGRTQQAQ